LIIIQQAVSKVKQETMEALTLLQEIALRSHLGDLVLRNVAPQAEENIIENNGSVIILLQSIDVDGNASNGITITPEAKTAVGEWIAGQGTLALNGESLQGIDSLESNLTALGQSFKDVNLTAAQAHVTETVKNKLASSSTSQLGTQVVVGDKIHYVDYKNAVRTAALTAGAAEYHTGTGFGKTLFDSAENKCQNCHNELYDTWEGSMHGRSWSDPIFQNNFEAFLRAQLALIGQTGPGATGRLYEQNTSVGIVTEKEQNMFSSAAQTCIACHAPGAFYARDVKINVTKISDEANLDETAFAALRATHERLNNPNGEIAVISANKAANRGSGAIYKATFQIGHEANKEGINCAFCHSIETPRLMGINGETEYTLKGDIRVGAHGPIIKAAGSPLEYTEDANNSDMNAFFRVVGPERPAVGKYHMDATLANRQFDGRYSMARKDVNGTGGNTHFTGGPFYGPFGVTGKANENIDDDSNRSEYVNPDFHYNDGFNHFADQGKALCLSCHQRSAGAFDGNASNPESGRFMELCTTWNAVATEGNNNHEDTASSPKCQKCHMERIEGTVLHQWGKPDQLFTDKEVLTPHFYPEDDDNKGDDNPVAAKWLNTHSFLGANKLTADPVASINKLKSGFDADITSEVSEDTLTITTTLANKTGHMLPGAHPMRRMLTRVIVTDAEGNRLTPRSTTGVSTFGDITNNLVTLRGKTLAASQPATVTVQSTQGKEDLNFVGKVPDLDGSSVGSQRFYSDGDGNVTIPLPTVQGENLFVENGVTKGSFFNAAIVNVDSNATDKFTRIYGHQTGRMLDIDNNASTPAVYVVRPGTDSNMARGDARLSPNETETYTLTYDINGTTGVKARYDVYYMQKGANGQFIEDNNTNSSEFGFLNQTASDAAKHMVTKAFSKTVTVN
jgi:hypothetical protein